MSLGVLFSFLLLAVEQREEFHTVLRCTPAPILNPKRGCFTVDRVGVDFFWVVGFGVGPHSPAWYRKPKIHKKRCKSMDGVGLEPATGRATSSCPYHLDDHRCILAGQKMVYRVKKI